MVDQRGPTLRAQWLGSELREMREQARLTIKEVAEYIRRNSSTVSRFESGTLPVRVPEVLAYLDICGVDDPDRRAKLKTMSQELFRKGWWDGYAGDVAGTLIDRIWLENRATEIHYFSTVVLPGLLQTRDYAATAIRTANSATSSGQLDRWIELRMARQQLLERDTPLLLTTVIDEGVLRRLVGGPSVMRDQLAHLTALADRPGIEVRILPFEAGAHASPDGPFDVFVMSEPYPDVVSMQTPAGAVYVEAASAAPLAAAYDRLRNAALSIADSVAFISDLVSRLE
jgi:transcriptional regulator with XRE-family HTH domain